MKIFKSHCWKLKLKKLEELQEKRKTLNPTAGS